MEFRMLRKSPGFSAVAVLTLALGPRCQHRDVQHCGCGAFASASLSGIPNELVVMFNVPLKRPDALSGIWYRDWPITEVTDRLIYPRLREIHSTISR